MLRVENIRIVRAIQRRTAVAAAAAAAARVRSANLVVHESTTAAAGMRKCSGTAQSPAQSAATWIAADVGLRTAAKRPQM